MLPKTNNAAKFGQRLLPAICAWMVFSAAFAGFVGAQQTEVVDRIVAVVNSDIITLYDLNRAFGPYEANIKALKYPPDKERQTLFQVRRDVLNPREGDDRTGSTTGDNAVTLSRGAQDGR